MPALPITIFADFTCAACYVTEAALWQLADTHDVSIRYRAAELDPGTEDHDPERDLHAAAAALGLVLRRAELHLRTTKAHEAALLARALGVERAMRAAIYAGYWGEGLDIGRIDVLQQLAPAVGLDPFDLKVALDIDRFRDDVQRDQEVARRLRVRGGPVLYLGTGPKARILIGAQTKDDLEKEILNFEF